MNLKKKLIWQRDLTINMVFELFEFSIGLLILNKINHMTDQNINILKSLDFLIASLVYMIISLKGLRTFINIPGGKYFYNFYTIFIVLGIVFTTIDIFNLKAGRVVNFNSNYALILTSFVVTAREKTFQDLIIKSALE